MNWRPATESEVHEMIHQAGGRLPPGTYTVFGGALSPELAEQLCGHLALLDHAIPPRAFEAPPRGNPDWAEICRLVGDDRLDALTDDVLLVVGIGKSWSVELRLDAGGTMMGLHHGPSLVFERRRQGMLQSNRGFFAPEDY